MTLQKEDLIIGELYEFKYGVDKEPNYLVYVGLEGCWYQFEQVTNRGVVWSEILSSDFGLIQKVGTL